MDDKNQKGSYAG
jgi:hypothetical protein